MESDITKKIALGTYKTKSGKDVIICAETRHAGYPYIGYIINKYKEKWDIKPFKYTASGKAYAEGGGFLSSSGKRIECYDLLLDTAGVKVIEPSTLYISPQDVINGIAANLKRAYDSKRVNYRYFVSSNVAVKVPTNPAMDLSPIIEIIDALLIEKGLMQ